VYAALLREATAWVQTLAHDRQWVGGTVGILAVLHTWSRTLDYHPHAHLLVTAGGLSSDGAAWVKPANPRFLVPCYMLSEIFRAKMRAAFARSGVDVGIDPKLWMCRWTVHVQQIESGEHATRYLSRYIYRVALSNHSLERFEHDRVTFRFTRARTQETRRLTLQVDVFIARFLLHVLPRGFTKVCYYGLLSPAGREDLERARHLLDLHSVPQGRPSAVAIDSTAFVSSLHDDCDSSSGASLDTTCITVAIILVIPTARHCAVCGRGHLRLVERYSRSRAPPSSGIHDRLAPGFVSLTRSLTPRSPSRAASARAVCSAASRQIICAKCELPCSPHNSSRCPNHRTIPGSAPQGNSGPRDQLRSLENPRDWFLTTSPTD